MGRRRHGLLRGRRTVQRRTWRPGSHSGHGDRLGYTAVHLRVRPRREVAAALTERVLGVRQANAALDQAVLSMVSLISESLARPTHQTVPIQLLDCLTREDNVFKLDKAHGPVDLLPEAHALEAWRPLEQPSKRFFEEVGWQGWGRDGRQIPYVERVDLASSAPVYLLSQGIRTGGF